MFLVEFYIPIRQLLNYFSAYARWALFLCPEILQNHISGHKKMSSVKYRTHSNHFTDLNTTPVPPNPSARPE